MNIPAHQSPLGFEQATVDAEHAVQVAKLNAKLAARKQRAAAKRQAEIDKDSRRSMRDAIARTKRADSYALCGISYYSVSPFDRDRGNFWRTCARCGKPLHYYPTYEEADANRRECRRD